MRMIVKNWHHIIFEPIIERAPSVNMPTSLDGSKLYFWRLHSKAWMKSDPFVWHCIEWRSTSSSDTWKSDVMPHTNIHICVAEVMSADCNDCLQRIVNTPVEYLGKFSFNTFLKYQLPAFVLSFGSDWRLQTFSRSLCNENFVQQQVNISSQNRI
jgi:hypothetical protein